MARRFTEEKRNFYEQVGERLREHYSGIPLKEIEEQTGIQYSNIHKKMYGNAEMSLAQAVALARGLHLSLDKLVEGIEVPEKP